MLPVPAGDAGRPQRRGGMSREPVIDDAVLLDGLRRGDDHAFATLVRQHGGRMLATARRFLRDDDEAQDAVQEAFVSAARAIGGFAGDAQPSTRLPPHGRKTPPYEPPRPRGPRGGGRPATPARVRRRRALTD